MGTQCAECGYPVAEIPGVAPNERNPCPSCGSWARLVMLEVAGEVALRGSLHLKGRHGPRGRWFVEMFVGADYWRNGRRWMTKLRRIDRDADTYDEVVSDPDTGETIYEQHEPLRQHWGHGDDRRTANGE